MFQKRNTHTHTHTHTERERERQRDRETERQRDRETEKHRHPLLITFHLSRSFVPEGPTVIDLFSVFIF